MEVPMAQRNDLNLKTAVSLLDDVAHEIEPFKATIAHHERSNPAEGEANFLVAFSKGAWAGFSGGLQIRKEQRGLLQKCDNAIKLATDVESAEPGCSVTLERDGARSEITPALVIAHAHLSKGVVHLACSAFADAQSALQRSLQILPTADGQLRLAYAIVGEGDFEQAVLAFQKVLDDFPESEEAVEARKVLLEFEGLRPRKWTTAILLSIFLGWAGADRFYLGYSKDGVIKLFTGGGLYIWWIADVIRIARGRMRDVNGLKLKR
jgi:tetratricopeptide (TPR) repeat protein